MARVEKNKIEALDASKMSDQEKRDLILSMRRLGGKKGTQKRKVPETDDELWLYIKEEIGDEVPRVAVCEDHDAPFDFMKDYYFERERAILVMSSRESGKTRGTAIINYIFAETKPNLEVCTFADIEAQSNKSYTYIKNFVYTKNDNGEKVLKSSVKGEPLRKETNFKNGSKLEVIIGCLPAYARVVTPEGSKQIQSLVGKRDIGPVKSFNFDTDEWEWKNITNWFHNGVAKKWTKIKLEIGSHGTSDLTATSNHEVFDICGRKRTLISLKAGESIAVVGDDLSNEQQQVLMGSLLGDGGISKGNEASKSVNKKGGHRYRVTHSAAQFYYLDWMADAFSEFKPTFFRRKAKNTKDVDFQCTRFFTEARKLWYPNGKKRIPDEVWERLDTLGLAVWMMDDGNVIKRKGGRPGSKGQYTAIVWSIAALIFNEHERNKCQEYFDNIGIGGSWNCVDKESDAWMWQATQEGSFALQSLISDYIDISEKQSRGWKKWIGPPIIEHSVKTVRPAKIEKISHGYELDPKNSRRFDIEVEGNHNYLTTTGVLVGNSKSGVNSPHPQKVHADEIDLMDEEIFYESRSMSSSKTLSDGTVIGAQDIATSTRKSNKGLMQKIINEVESAKKHDLKPPWRIYKSCLWEVAQEAPNCRSAPKDEREARLKELGKDPCELCECNKVAKGEWAENVPRTLESVCKGKLFKSRGWMRYPDIVGKFTQNSPQVWVAQLECRRPMADGLYLPTWSRERYCVDKNTSVLTRDGYRRAGDLVDNTIEVATIDGKYRKAEWFNAGKQKLYEIEFDNGQKIKATGNHTWPIRCKGTKFGWEWAFTSEILDRRVLLCDTIVECDKNKEFKEGVQHGFTFGDGTVESKYRKTSLAMAYSSAPQKQQFMIEWFDDVSGWKDGRCVESQLPVEYKKLPSVNNKSKNYLCGFIAGWIASDGCVSDGGPRIDCIQKDAIDWLSNLLFLYGISNTTRKNSKMRTAYGEGDSWSIKIPAQIARINADWMVLRDDQSIIEAKKILRSTKVLAIKEIGYDDVVCCEEPETHTWVTSKGIVTGNCVRGYEPRPEYGFIWMGVDWGGSANSISAVLWIQGPLHQPLQVNNTLGTKTIIPQGAYVIFKEINEASMGATRLADKVVRQEIQYKNRFGGSWRVKSRFADKAGAQQRADWREHNPPLRTQWYLSGSYLDPTIECLQSIVSDSLLYVDDQQCPGVCDDFESWRSAQGKEVHDSSSHNPAAARYCLKNVSLIMKRYSKDTTRAYLQPVIAVREGNSYPGQIAVGSTTSADYSSENWRSTLGHDMGDGGPNRGGREPWQP